MPRFKTDNEAFAWLHNVGFRYEPVYRETACDQGAGVPVFFGWRFTLVTEFDNRKGSSFVDVVNALRYLLKYSLPLPHFEDLGDDWMDVTTFAFGVNCPKCGKVMRELANRNNTREKLWACRSEKCGYVVHPEEYEQTESRD